MDIVHRRKIVPITPYKAIRESVPYLAASRAILTVPLSGFSIVQPPNPGGKCLQVNPRQQVIVVGQDDPRMNLTADLAFDSLEQDLGHLAESFGRSQDLPMLITCCCEHVEVVAFGKVGRAMPRIALSASLVHDFLTLLGGQSPVVVHVYILW
jgi:hypothetical protein